MWYTGKIFSYVQTHTYTCIMFKYISVVTDEDEDGFINFCNYYVIVYFRTLAVSTLYIVQ
jgi:hypothetical protein